MGDLITWPVCLVGPRASLVPLRLSHAADLLEAGKRGEVWTYLDEPTPATLAEVEALIKEALDEADAAQRVPFAIIHRESDRAVGSVSYIDIQPRHRAVEIGWAWLSPDYWSQGIGREVSQMLIEHAFMALDAVRVVFKADARNVRSQRTIDSLGAVREGLFRRHRILRDGTFRDSVYFSLLREDWEFARQSGF